MGRRYTFHDNAVTISTAITIIEITAATNNGFHIISAYLRQSGSTTSATAIAQWVRKSAAGTGTSMADGTDIQKHRTADAAFQGTGRVIITAEGTIADEFDYMPFNVLNGLFYRPLPEERIYCEGAEIIGLRFPVAPASQSWSCGIVIEED